jgi:glycosyltransferase involved in cell wall biosynthesis
VTKPRVSVVICFLNGAEFLPAAIDSVLAQTMTDFELYLVDDGSTDGSSEIAQRYVVGDSRLRYVEHEGHVNLGLSASRNVGIRAAQGDFIALLDADDIWMPSKLEEQLAIFDRHPELGMVCGAARYWGSWSGGEDRIVQSGPRQDVPIRPPEASVLTYPLGIADAPCPSDFLLRRTLVLELGGFEEHFRNLYEDQAFLAKLYLVAPVYFSSRVWLDYRLHPSSIMATVGTGPTYHKVRRYFLEWFEGYIGDRPNVDARVKAATQRALFQYRAPRRHAARVWLRRQQGRLSRLIRRLS